MFLVKINTETTNLIVSIIFGLFTTGAAILGVLFYFIKWRHEYSGHYNKFKKWLYKKLSIKINCITVNDDNYFLAPFLLASIENFIYPDEKLEYWKYKFLKNNVIKLLVSIKIFDYIKKYGFGNYKIKILGQENYDLNSLININFDQFKKIMTPGIWFHVYSKKEQEWGDITINVFRFKNLKQFKKHFKKIKYLLIRTFSFKCNRVSRNKLICWINFIVYNFKWIYINRKNITQKGGRKVCPFVLDFYPSFSDNRDYF